MAAVGWDTTVERFPDPHEPDHLAALSFNPTDVVTDAPRRQADAILRRRTDRLPFNARSDWAETEPRPRLAVIPHHVMADVVRDRPNWRRLLGSPRRCASTTILCTWCTRSSTASAYQPN